MKKRVKLLTTIASLCLAVALMAFGVYAANNADFKTNSTVSFTASADVYGVFTAYYTPTNGTKTGEIQAQRTNAAGETWKNVTGLTGTDDVKNLMGGTGFELGDSGNDTTLKLAAVNDIYTFTYTFKNDSPYDVTCVATLTDETNVMQANTPASVGIQISKTAQDGTAEAQTVAEKTSTITLSAGETATWIQSVKLLSLDIAASDTFDMSFSLAVNKANS